MKKPKPKNNKQSVFYALTPSGEKYVHQQKKADEWNEWVKKKEQNR